MAIRLSFRYNALPLLTLWFLWSVFLGGEAGSWPQLVQVLCGSHDTWIVNTPRGAGVPHPAQFGLPPWKALGVSVCFVSLLLVARGIIDVNTHEVILDVCGLTLGTCTGFVLSYREMGVSISNEAVGWLALSLLWVILVRYGSSVAARRLFVRCRKCRDKTTGRRNGGDAARF